MRTDEYFTLGEITAAVIPGDLLAMAKMLNDVTSEPYMRLDENAVDDRALVHRGVVIRLFARRAGDRVGRKLLEFMETF